MGDVQDVTISDHTVMSPGEEFVKRWRVTNAGNVTWPDSAVLRHTSQDPLPKSAEVAVPALEPGKTTEIEVAMVAPSAPGTYQSLWALCSGDRVLTSEIYVLIEVQAAAVPPQPAECLVYVTRTGKRYHTATCQTNASPVPLTVALARGLTPCGNCHPACP